MKGLLGRARDILTRLFVKLAANFLAQEIYRGIHGRPADDAGSAFVTGAIRRTGRIAPILKEFLGSREFRGKSSGISLPDLVTLIFKGLLGREPAPEGLKMWVHILRANNDTTAFMRAVMKTDEFRRIMYTRHREPPKRLATIKRPETRRLIVVSSNCQTAGITAGLQGCFPDDAILPLPLRELVDTTMDDQVLAHLRNADFWVSTPEERILNRLASDEEESRVQAVQLPFIEFRAFHPDLCFVQKIVDGQRITVPYNSAIAAWAYNRGVTVEDARKLFNRESYAALGYLDAWRPSITVLGESFASCGLDFARFMQGLKRSGVFMYSTNHPKAEVLVWLAKLISLKLGATESVLEKPIIIGDGLTGDIWPLYPEIADELSLPGGSYDWKHVGEWIPGLDRYLEFAFSTYAHAEIPVGGLRLQNRDEELYDRVLGPQVGIV